MLRDRGVGRLREREGERERWRLRERESGREREGEWGRDRGRGRERHTHTERRRRQYIPPAGDGQTYLGHKLSRCLRYATISALFKRARGLRIPLPQIFCSRIIACGHVMKFENPQQLQESQEKINK